MRGFSWIIDRRVAALPRPGRGGDELAVLDRDLAFLAAQGIALVVTLTVEPLPPERLQAHGLAGLHLPVIDFAAPTQTQLRRFLDNAVLRIEGGQAVAVHCTAGKGRTGTFMAAYLVHQGMEPAEAMAEVRRLRPGSIETDEQEAAVRELASSRRRQ